MKRYLEVFLAALAVAGAVAAVTQRSDPRPTVAVGLGAPTAPPLPDAATAQGPMAVTSSSPPPRPTTVAGAKSVAIAVSARMKDHGTVMLAAGLSYYALLAVFPAAIAAVTIWAIGADPAVLESQIAEFTSALPETTAMFVEDQILDIVDAPEGALGVTTALSVLAAVWSASAGTKALITGINYAYDQEETRSFFTLRLAAIGVTLGLIVFGLGAVVAVGFLPDILSAVGLEDSTGDILNVARWPVVFVIVILGIGALYKLAPNRPWRMTPWISVGAVTATLLWVAATVGLSFYVNNFGSSFGATYGTLAGMIVLMLWFFVSGLIILVGAEMNSDLEHRGVY